jgi:hypothetical protein
VTDLQTDRTLHVDVGGGARMSLPRRDWLYQMNWCKEPDRGTKCSDRMLAVGVLESYLYLVESCSKQEAWRRIKLMRAAIKANPL